MEKLEITPLLFDRTTPIYQRFVMEQMKHS